MVARTTVDQQCTAPALTAGLADAAPTATPQIALDVARGLVFLHSRRIVSALPGVTGSHPAVLPAPQHAAALARWRCEAAPGRQVLCLRAGTRASWSRFITCLPLCRPILTSSRPTCCWLGEHSPASSATSDAAACRAYMPPPCTPPPAVSQTLGATPAWLCCLSTAGRDRAFQGLLSHKFPPLPFPCHPPQGRYRQDCRRRHGQGAEPRLRHWGGVHPGMVSSDGQLPDVQCSRLFLRSGTLNRWPRRRCSPRRMLKH